MGGSLPRDCHDRDHERVPGDRPVKRNKYKRCPWPGYIFMSIILYFTLIQLVHTLSFSAQCLETAAMESGETERCGRYRWLMC